ncbi:MAG: hypothetical protein AAF613_04655 [Pseudomonadota bacterium]
MASGIGALRTSFLFRVLVFAAVITIWTGANYFMAGNRIMNDCNEIRLGDDSNTFCACFASEIRANVPKQSYLPIVGYFSRPGEAAISQLAADANAQCRAPEGQTI